MLLAHDAWQEASAAATSRALPPNAAWLASFQNELHARASTPVPRLLTSLRTECPRCATTLVTRPQKRGAHKLKCCILLDAGAIHIAHLPKFCPSCKWPRFWCGYIQDRPSNAPEKKARVKTCRRLDVAFQHPDIWMCNSFFGIRTTWLRRWRYRMYLQRSSFQSEALLLRLADGLGSTLRGFLDALTLPCIFWAMTFGCSSSSKPLRLGAFMHAKPKRKIFVQDFSPCSWNTHVFHRSMLSDAWVRELLWRRSQELQDEQRQQLAKDLQSLPVEMLIHKSWAWYAPLMLQRRGSQWLRSGDRTSIIAMDGNAKLYRRTCGQPFAEARLTAIILQKQKFISVRLTFQLPCCISMHLICHYHIIIVLPFCCRLFLVMQLASSCSGDVQLAPLAKIPYVANMPQPGMRALCLPCMQRSKRTGW